MNEGNRIPLWVKLAYTAFMTVLVPVYWANYGPANFLYFCDIALFFALVAVWKEDSLLASIPAVGIFFPQMLWCVDFTTGFFGYSPLGMTGYMFEPERSLLLRGLSLFHGWLPFLLLWMVMRLGYDRRAFKAWWAISWAAMLVAYSCLPAEKDPDAPLLPYNINYVFGLEERQTWMAEWQWLAIMLIAIPLVLALPSHLLFQRTVRRVA